MFNKINPIDVTILIGLIVISIAVYLLSSGKICINGFIGSTKSCPMYSYDLSSNILGYTFEYSEGTCASNKDCEWAGDACGGGHGVCTNRPKDYKGAISICDINNSFPANRGFSCGCIQNKCGWKK